MTTLPGLRDGGLADLGLLRDGPLAEALAALNGAGEETRLVGGAVRDLALGLAAQDFDLATTALPAETMRRAEQAGLKAVPTGFEHGTVTLVVRGRAIETTTLREDVETDGRRAKVIFGRDFLADARRRDFTINALSLTADGRVHDSVGGLADLAARRVRFIGEADARIREDYLRILRFFRFSARFADGPLDGQGFSAAIRNREGIGRLSRERVRAELMKLIVAPRAAEVVRIMGEAGLLEPIFAGMAYPGRLARLATIEDVRNAAPDPMLRLVALAVVTVGDAERLRQRLRLSNEEGRRAEAAAATLATLHGIETPPSERALTAMLFTLGRDGPRDALALAQAEAAIAPNDSAFAEADRRLHSTLVPKSPLSGRDVLARGVPPGPRVGAIVRAFEQAWIESGFPGDAERFARMLDEAIAATPNSSQ